MSKRAEFSAKTKEDAFDRSDGRCENVIAGVRCPVILCEGWIEYDHIVADQLGGKATLENCAVLCRACHRLKTAMQDQPRIAKAKRQARGHINAKAPTAPIPRRPSAPKAKPDKLPAVGAPGMARRFQRI